MVTHRTVVVLAALSLLSACGGEEPVAPGAWAKSVCKAVKPWSAEIQKLQTQTRDKLAKRSDAGQAKKELVTLFGGMEQATDSALAEMKEAGVPDVSGGQRIADGFVSALTSARNSFGVGRKAVEALPTADRKAFYDGVVAAGDVIRKENENASEPFRNIGSAELDKAFGDAPECR
jgi:hypothetical protein